MAFFTPQEHAHPQLHLLKAARLWGSRRLLISIGKYHSHGPRRTREQGHLHTAGRGSCRGEERLTSPSLPPDTCRGCHPPLHQPSAPGKEGGRVFYQLTSASTNRGWRCLEGCWRGRSSCPSDPWRLSITPVPKMTQAALTKHEGRGLEV